VAEDNRNFRKETKPLEMSDCHRLFRGFLILSKLWLTGKFQQRFLMIHGFTNYQMMQNYCSFTFI
jgi:hypothetical protein